MSDGVRERYRRDAEVQTSSGAHAQYDRVVAHWTTHGNVTALLVRPEPVKKAAEAEAPKARTWNDVLKWWKANKAPQFKGSTVTGYMGCFEGPQFRTWDRLAITALTTAFFEKWTTEIIISGVGDSCVRNCHIAMRSVLRTAHECKEIPALPPFIKLPKVGTKIVQAASQEDVDLILSEPVGRYCGEVHARQRAAARLAFRLAIYAGLRASEIRGLRWPDVDLQKRRRIIVRHAVIAGVIDTPKSGHEREIPICDALYEALTEASVSARRKANQFGLVAPRADGEPWGDTGLRQALQRACARLSLSTARVHALRHYFVTALFEGGVPAPEVQKLAGHASLSQTQRYAHTSQERLAQAVAVLDRPRGNSVATGAMASKAVAS
jgi:integrase